MDRLTDSSSICGDRVQLLDRMNRDGYVFLRDVGPKAELEAASLELHSCLEELGLVEPGESFVWTGRNEDEVPSARMHEIIHDRVPLAAVWRSPKMQSLLETVIGGPVHVFPYSDVRTYHPGQDKYLSPAHQDAHYIGPNRDYFTAWIPLTSIPEQVGGLAIAESSHLGGLRRHRKRDDRRSHLPGHVQRFGIDYELIQERWLTEDYRLGDVLIFTPFTVHQAPTNRSERSVRVSTDTRFQPASTPRSRLATMTAEDVRRQEMASASRTPSRG